MTATPAQLDHAGIAARIPHAGRMCLLDSLAQWSATELLCHSASHQATDHPLGGPDGLPATAAVEYAAQAMALHGGLQAAPGTPPSAGYIASVRGLVLQVLDLQPCPAPLRIWVQRLAGDERQVMYRFTLHDGQHALLAEGRATVVLNTPLAMPPSPPMPTPSTPSSPPTSPTPPAPGA
ncbi:hydroxymyristoyl-ACP dehydratase [Aquabacterium sp. OR-4]|uniref:hydroxymyristoyl-ACP dehydratase n=1 Tax=Aquabacterium sp. OR-4 TaxID=2978127 RepID=UPI0021B273D2|nr:hydroxymyristoyl-ACP dehydratase [Aquabacterium sp. OR-4]MDT7836746.1 hydroxymyristoyl-ACP dehydratase [Aquabacterium sp. OR-4]